MAPRATVAPFCRMTVASVTVTVRSPTVRVVPLIAVTWPWNSVSVRSHSSCAWLPESVTLKRRYSFRTTRSMASVASVPGPVKRRAVAPAGTCASRKLPDAPGVAEMLVPGTSTRSACEALRSFPWMVAPAICGAAVPEPQPASNSKPTPIDPMLNRMAVLPPRRRPQLATLTRDLAPVGQMSDPSERRSPSCRASGPRRGQRRMLPRAAPIGGCRRELRRDCGAGLFLASQQGPDHAIRQEGQASAQPHPAIRKRRIQARVAGAPSRQRFVLVRGSLGRGLQLRHDGREQQADLRAQLGRGGQERAAGARFVDVLGDDDRLREREAGVPEKRRAALGIVLPRARIRRSHVVGNPLEWSPLLARDQPDPPG